MLNNENETEDILVYPIVYNTRHSIELVLKIIIEQLWKLQNLKGIRKPKELIQQEKREVHLHDIKKLYDIVEGLGEIDRRISTYYKGVEPLIEIYYFDKDRDAFKYEADLQGHSHMIQNGISHISINTLGEQFNVIMEKLDKIIYFLKNCIRESQLDIFTKHLSRKDIENISKLPPTREKWNQDQFIEVKNEVRKKYSISGREFSRALNIIQRHRKCCANIGLEILFQTIPDEEFEAYASLVHQAIIEKQEIERDNENGIDLQWSLSNIQKSSKGWNKYVGKIQISTLNLLLIFREMSNSYVEVENLEQIFIFFSESKYDEKIL